RRRRRRCPTGRPHPSHRHLSDTGVGRRREGLGMSEVTYVSQVRIERIKGPLRRAHLPEEPVPVLFGVHGAIAKHYGVTMEGREAHAATLDYVVASAAGCLTRTPR